MLILPRSKEAPWEALTRLVKGPMTPAKAAGTGLFLMLFGAPFMAWGTGPYATIGVAFVGFGLIALIVGIVWGLVMIDPKKGLQVTCKPNPRT